MKGVRSQGWRALAQYSSLWPLLGGLLMALGPAPINFWVFPWFALVPLWWTIGNNRSSLRSGFFSGFLWGLMYHGLSLAWITGLHPLTWMGISYGNSLAIVGGIWGLITLWGAIGVGVWSGALTWMVRQGFSPACRILVATALWCGIETLRSLTPLDWTGLAYTQSPGNIAILHLSQLSGNALITATIVAVNGMIAETLPDLKSAYRFRFSRLWPAIGLLMIAHLLGWGLSVLSTNTNTSTNINTNTNINTSTSTSTSASTQPVAPVRIGTVQGNIPTRIKLSPAGIRQGFKNYGSGYEILAAQGAQMVIFPEGSLPLDWADYPDNPIAQTVRRVKTPLIVGAFAQQGKRSTQALLMLDDRGKITSQYDKVKVVPLGEALPFEEILGQWIGRLSPIKDFLIPGRSDQVFTTPFGPAAVGICYESAFPELFRHQVQRGATFLITASNLDPYSTVLMAQHEAHDVMRAIETDRNLIRVTNTGYSGLISATGERKWRSQPQSYDLHLSEVFPRQTRTLYVQYGNWITPVLGILSLGTIVADRKLQSPKL